jgi:hypothetical protein
MSWKKLLQSNKVHRHTTSLQVAGNLRSNIVIAASLARKAGLNEAAGAADTP